MIKRRENFFRTGNDAVLYFETHGEGPPIVLLHGFLCSSRFFHRNVEALSQNHRLVLMDFRGHGSSSKALYPHTLSRYARDVKELMDYLELEEAILVGWSMGGSVALAYHAMFGTHRIRALGIIDQTLSPFHPGEWNTHGLRGYDMDKANQLLIESYTGYAGYCRRIAEKLLFFDEDKRDLEWMTQEMLKTPPWIAFCLYTEYPHTDGLENLEKVHVPIAFFGADSPTCPNGRDCATRYYPERLAAGVYRESHPHEYGGHLLMLYDNVRFHQELLGFIERTAQFSKTKQARGGEI